MRPEEERSFGTDDPVGRYWLHNCVGFGVRGLRTGRGVVRGVTEDSEGVAVLTIQRGVLRGTAQLSAARVASVDPWDETIVLRSRTYETRQRRAEQARDAADVVVMAARGAVAAAAFGARALLLAGAALVRAHGPRDAADVVVTAARGAVAAAAFGARALLLAGAALVRTHGPGVRQTIARFAATLALLGRAYAAETARAYRAQRDAFAAWNDARRRGTWGDESPITRAGADEVDARTEEEIRR